MIVYQFPRINFTVTKQELFIESNLKTFEICCNLDVWMSSIVDVTPDPVIKTESLYLFISQSSQDTRFRLYTGKKSLN